jgi:hypothetical protein
LELTVVRNSKRTYLEIMGQRGMFPSPQVSAMHLRFEPRTDRNVHSPTAAQGDRELHWHPSRGVQSSLTTLLTDPQPYSLNQKRTAYNWLPIFNRRLSDVPAWHWANPVRLHPVYMPEYLKDGNVGGQSPLILLPSVHLCDGC